MKVLLFTHKSDIDGMGNAVLAKLAFPEVDYVLCETFNLEQEVAKYLDSGEIYNYDYIFVTDLWLEDPTLSKVAEDKNLKDKFFVFDHHASALKEGYDKYDFTTVRVSDSHGLCCGTSLFYEYLLAKGFLEENNTTKEFVELTRKYDTWEWKTKYNEENARELTLLFDSVGCNGYINLMFQKLNERNIQSFNFSELERMLIDNKINQVEEKLAGYARKIFYKEVCGLKAGIIFIDYEFRNDLAEYLRHQKLDIDFVMLIALDYGTVSYRNIKEDVNVRLIAEAMGGKGHDKAASRPISENEKQELIRILTKEKAK